MKKIFTSIILMIFITSCASHYRRPESIQEKMARFKAREGGINKVPDYYSPIGSMLKSHGRSPASRKPKSDLSLNYNNKKLYFLTLYGQYTTLQLHNRMTGEDGQTFVFEGTGYYQSANENALTGVWIDSQGNILPLHATIDDLTLVVIWGNEESKLGRSVYRLLPGGELEAVNSIKGQAGEWEEFGRAVLKRK